MKTVRLRKEVVRCNDCKKPKEFFYLSDFAYGQRLVFFKGSTQMAFVNFIEDKVYNEYIDIVKKVIGEAENNEEIMEFVQASFGITCDKINNYKVDFLCGQKKCLFCGSDKFERNMIEPESLVNMEVSEITHKTWKKLSEEQKVFEVKKAWGEFGNSF